MNTQADTCLTCGGLIMVPGTTWGGKICYCPEPPGRFRRRAGEESQNELEADRDRWKKRAEDMGDKAHDTWDELEKAKARIEELTHLWAKDNNALVDALLQNKRLLDTIEEIKSTSCKFPCEHVELGFSQCRIHWLVYHATDKNNQKANE